MQIRPFHPETDLERLVEIANQANAVPTTVEEMWHRERNAPPNAIRLRLAAVDERGRVVGVGSSTWASHLPEGRFTMRILVDQHARKQGIGSRLFDGVLALAREAGARELEASVREIHPEALRFARERGFRIRRHLFASTLDLTTFDEAPLAAAIERAQAAGFRFFTFADLAGTEAEQRQYYELDCEANRDIPGYDHNAPSFEEWQTYVFKASWYRPDGEIFAARGDRWAGVTSVGIYPEKSMAVNSFTGVRREFRGHGLAQALKVLATRMARRHGMDRIRTNNDSENVPMLAINRKFGYVPEPGDYLLIRDHL